ncbi:MAG TPA: class II aldolase/adducin family protein [Candidatus Limnocylindrales bacterium]|nr:class II aldolase/adducin family protein [Candidatus Limnocylindrales bacterium]
MALDGAETGSDEAALRAAIVAAGRRLRAAGLVAATEGNLSVRLGEGSLLITPAGRRKDELAVGDLVVAPLVGEAATAGERPPGGHGPSSDVAIHRAAYAARPDVTAVVHAHLPASMALTVAGEIPDPSALPETALFLGRLPFLPFGEPGSEELASRVGAVLAEEVGPRPVAVLLERHGAVAIGCGDGVAAVTSAVDRLELVEVLCRTWRDAVLLRAARAAARRDGLAGSASSREP